MAKAEIKCTCPECGTTHYWSVTCCNRREADAWEARHADEANTRLCRECYAKVAAAERAAARETENATAAKEAAELSLPELTGSEKQVAWATSIRMKAIDNALSAAAGGSVKTLNDKGRDLVRRVMAKMPTEAKWWIDGRDEAAIRVRDELECTNWAELPEETRAAELAKSASVAAEAESRKPLSRIDVLRLGQVKIQRRYEAARIAGRTYAEQCAFEAAEAARAAVEKKAVEEAEKPAKLVVRLGFAETARWNGKFYGRDGLRVYIDNREVQVPAETKKQWQAEWDAYKAARK